MADELKTAWNAKGSGQNSDSMGKSGNSTAETRTHEAEDGNCDRLSDSGIFRHGYGLIPKYAMRDRELTLTAKSIYAYLCSLCGGGETAFPGVETIRATLDLGKNSYYQHRHLLEAAGYITVEHRHTGRTYTTNLYVLNENPKRFQRQVSEEWQDRIFAAVQFSGLRGAGYGILPRVVMTDSRLNAKAKAVYAYFASFTGTGTAAFPSRFVLLRDLNISIAAYYKYLNQLKEAGYLATKQRVTRLRFSINEYYLLDGQTEPNTADNKANNAELGIIVNPCTQNRDTIEPKELKHSLDYVENSVENSAENVENSITVNLCAQNRDMIEGIIVNPCTNFPYIINRDTTNNKYTNNLSLYLSIKREKIFEQMFDRMDGTESEEKKQVREPQEKQKRQELEKNHQSQTENQPKQKKNNMTDWTSKRQKYTEPANPCREETEQILKSSLGYEDIPVMYPHIDMTMINNLVNLMVSTLCNTHGPSLQIGQRTYSREEIHKRFLSLNVEHLQYVLDCVKKTERTIRNPRTYYLTALLNAPDTMELYYQRKVEEDMRFE